MRKYRNNAIRKKDISVTSISIGSSTKNALKNVAPIVSLKLLYEGRDEKFRYELEKEFGKRYIYNMLNNIVILHKK